MKAYKALVCFLLAIATQTVTVSASSACVGCVVVVSVLEQLAMRHKTDVPSAVNMWCAALANNNPLIAGGCSMALTKYGNIIQVDYAAGKTPDETCATSLDMCKDTPQCKLWKTWPPKRFSDWKPSLHLARKADEDATFSRALLVTDKDLHTYVKYIFTKVAYYLGIKDESDPILSLDFKQLISNLSTTAAFLDLNLPTEEVEAINAFMKVNAMVKPIFDEDKVT